MMFLRIMRNSSCKKKCVLVADVIVVFAVVVIVVVVAVVVFWLIFEKKQPEVFIKCELMCKNDFTKTYLSVLLKSRTKYVFKNFVVEFSKKKNLKISQTYRAAVSSLRYGYVVRETKQRLCTTVS